jgi:hypothetical protein
LVRRLSIGDPASRRESTPARLRRREPLILIVDDAAQTGELYAQYLTYRGLGVVGAPTSTAPELKMRALLSAPDA